MKTIQLNNSYRTVVVGTAVFAGCVGWSLWSQPKLFEIPVYDALLKLAPLRFWSALWATIAVVSVVAVLTRSVKVWVAGAVGSTAIAACWLAGLSWAHFVDDARLSLTGWSLWAYYAWSQWWLVLSADKFVDR